MALLNRKENQRDKRTVIEDDAHITYGTERFKSKDRQPVQVDPPVADMVRNISYAKDIPMYEVIRVAMEAYLNTLNESERQLYEMKKNR